MMKFIFLVLALQFGLLSNNASEAKPLSLRTENAATIRVILVGDSTMSPRSGYGDALCQRFKTNVSCINLARGGRSSSSFRVEGLWNNVQNLLRAGGNYSATYVLIQFGHNDQPGKPGRSTDLLTEFPVNMANYAKEVKDLGGIPVLITPLTRRTFHNDVLENNLLPWSEAIKKVAKEYNVALLDLNAESYAAVQAMGPVDADSLAMSPPPENLQGTSSIDTNKVERVGSAKTDFDRTHLGAKGAALFSKMVEDLFKIVVPTSSFHFKDAN